MLLYSSLFKKQFKKLPKRIQEKFEARMELFVNDPFDPILSNHNLHGEYAEFRSINITGNYRAIYRESEENAYLFIEIGTHSELYE